MRRGDIVTVDASGDYGKARPAVIVQSDSLPAAHDADRDAVSCHNQPTPDNGLRSQSHIMAEKPMTLRRAKVGPVIGRLSAPQARALNAALAFALGLAD